MGQSSWAMIFYGIAFDKESPEGVEESFAEDLAQLTGGEHFDDEEIIYYVTAKHALGEGVALPGHAIRGIAEKRMIGLTLGYYGFDYRNMRLYASTPHSTEWGAERFDPAALIVEPAWADALEGWCDLVGLDRGRIGWHLAPKYS